MRKFRVIIEETAVYAIVVKAKNKDAAAEAAEEVFVQSEDRDKFFTHVVDRGAIDIEKLRK